MGIVAGGAADANLSDWAVFFGITFAFPAECQLPGFLSADSSRAPKNVAKDSKYSRGSVRRAGSKRSCTPPV